MKLIIGGYAQGKLRHALEQLDSKEWIVLDGKALDGEILDRETADRAAMDGEAADGRCTEKVSAGKKVVFNHFHSWVRERIAKGGYPEEEIAEYLAKHPDCIIISDEIGNGIVPMDAFEREYRERTGRILVELAGRAEEVVRVICGIGQKIK